MKTPSVSRSIFCAVKTRPFLSLSVILTAVGTALCELLPPLVLEQIVDHIAAKDADGSAFLSLAVLWLLSSVLAGFCKGARDVLITVLGQKVTHALRSEMCKKLSRLPADAFVRAEPGVTVERILGDVGTVETLFESGIIGFASDILTLIGICAVMVTKAPGIGLFLLPSLPLVLAMTLWFRKMTRKAQLRNREAIGRAGGILPETLRNLRTVRTCGARKFMMRRYEEALADSFRATEKTNSCDAVYSPIILVLNGILVALTVLFASKEGAGGALFGMTAGTAAAMIAYIGKVFDPIQSIGMEIQSIQSAGAGVQRVNAFLQAAEKDNLPRLSPENSSADFPGIPALSLSRVDFSYRPENPVLRGFSLSVAPGETVTLTGRTGAGKSTVFRLLLGLYTPQSGEIRLFGQNPAQIRESEKRSLYGYVEQDFPVIPGTVRDQITLGDPRITEDAVKEALRLVGLAGTVEKLPGGLQTKMSPGLFSQGQLQLLNVARAVAGDPKLLLLDEITANLDSETEAKLLDALEAASAGRTVISVSHRLYEMQLRGRTVQLQ